MRRVKRSLAVAGSKKPNHGSKIESFVSVFGQGDYRRAFFREEGENEFRFSFGVRFGLR